MYKNSEHYSDPTAGKALANIMSEKRWEKCRRRSQHEAATRMAAEAAKKRKREKARAREQRRQAHRQYVHVWDAPDVQVPIKRAV